MTYKDLIKELKQGIVKSLYLFTGDEQLMIRQAVDLLKQQMVDPEYADFNLVWVDGEESPPEKLFGAIETLPFFQDRKLVIVKDAPYFKSTQDKLSDSQRERLEALLSNPAEDTVLVFLAPQTDKRKRVSKALIAKGQWVSFDKLDRPDFEKWLARQADSAGMKLPPTELKYLMEVSGYLDKNSELTLLDFSSNLERLFGYAGQASTVSRSHIDAIFEKPLEYNIFMMVDHIADSNVSQALSMLRELQQDGEAEIKILFMIARHFRILLRIHLNREAGVHEKEMASKVGVPPFLVKKYIAQVNRIGFKDIKKALEQILESDRAMKTGRIDPEIGLEMLIVRLGVKE